jgi:hypothetical protein
MSCRCPITPALLMLALFACGACERLARPRVDASAARQTRSVVPPSSRPASSLTLPPASLPTSVRLEHRDWLSLDHIQPQIYPHFGWDTGILRNVFGCSLSLSGSELAVITRSAIRLYRSNGTQWSHVARIDIDWNREAGPLALSGDLLAAGVIDVPSIVYIYRRRSQGFSLEQKLRASPRTYGESAVWVGDDLVVSEIEGVGIYRRVRGSWKRVQVLRPSDPRELFGDNLVYGAGLFGDKLAYGSGLLAVQGGRLHSPAVHLFEKSGPRWIKLTRLPLSNPVIGGDWLGGWSKDRKLRLYQRTGKDRWVLSHTFKNACAFAELGRDWLVTADCVRERLLLLYRRQKERWVLASQAVIPKPPLAVQHYGDAPLDSVPLTSASDGRWVFVTILVSVKEKARVAISRHLRTTSGVAVYEIVSGASQ